MSSPKALQKLYRLEKSSSRFPAQIAAILDGTEYKVCIKSLQDNELVWLVEYLDTVRLRIIQPLLPPILNFRVDSPCTRDRRDRVRDMSARTQKDMRHPSDTTTILHSSRPPSKY